MPKFLREKQENLIRALASSNQILYSKGLFSQAQKLQHQILMIQPFKSDYYGELIKIIQDSTDDMYPQDYFLQILPAFSYNYDLLLECLNRNEKFKKFQLSIDIIQSAQKVLKNKISSKQKGTLYLKYASCCLETLDFTSNYSKALKKLQIIQNDFQQQPNLKYYLNNLKQQLSFGIGDYEKTVHCCEQLTKLRKERTAQYQKKICICCLFLGQLQKAYQYLQNNCIYLNTINISLYILKAYCEQTMSQKQDAKQSLDFLDKVYEVDDDNGYKLSLLQIMIFDIHTFKQCKKGKYFQFLLDTSQVFNTSTQNYFPDQFNSFSNFCKYRKYLAIFVDMLKKSSQSSDTIKQIARALFLIMIGGDFENNRMFYLLDQLCNQKFSKEVR